MTWLALHWNVPAMKNRLERFSAYKKKSPRGGFLPVIAKQWPGIETF